MKVLVSGSSGLVGSALVESLTAGRSEAIRLVRPQSGYDGNLVPWDPVEGRLDSADLEGLDAVVHLAGESIASGRWTPERKDRIRKSRIDGTTLLATTLSRLKHRPRVFVCASAIGYYGSRGDEVLREESDPGRGFLADLTRAWEEACAPAREAGLRVVNLRIGVVLHPAGGALAKLLPIFRFGLGGRIGGGRQYMSWIALDDLVLLIQHALTSESLSGPVNAVAPNALTNKEFTRILAHVLGRPALFPAPAPLLRLLFGGMAEETLLTSQRVEPARALASGYRFRFPELEGALRHLLGNRADD